MKINIPLILLAVLLAFFGFLPEAWAVTPAPDGGYPNLTTAEGQDALFSLSTGAANTGVGWFSLKSVTTGSFNTGVGAGTLVLNSADSNTATGAAALLLNTTGSGNTANGTATLVHNSGGDNNTAVGAFALNSNTIGSGNTATGFDALFSNTEGNVNTAIGFQALFNNTSTFAIQNTATGFQALFSNTEGGFNTAIGTFALFDNTGGNNNTAIGISALDSSTGSNNTALGQFAGVGVTTANNVIVIGTAGADVNDSCFIGNIYSNVQPIVGTDPDSVTITSSGRLGRGNVSSRRYKHDIQPINEASEALYALKPVSFRYNKEYDATQTLAFGLIAEEVAEVYPDLVGRNAQGQPESVRYEQINAMLLNEFLKAHRKAEEQQRQIDVLTAQLKQQGAQIQKVSAQMEVSRPTPQLARSSN